MVGGSEPPSCLQILFLLCSCVCGTRRTHSLAKTLPLMARAGFTAVPGTPAVLGAELRSSPRTDEIFKAFSIEEERQLRPPLRGGRRRGAKHVPGVMAPAV